MRKQCRMHCRWKWSNTYTYMDDTASILLDAFMHCLLSFLFIYTFGSIFYLQSSIFFRSYFIRCLTSARLNKNSRVTLECVYDLKPRYFVRPTIMMTSLKQTKVANKRQTLYKITKERMKNCVRPEYIYRWNKGKIHFTRTSTQP